MRAGSGVHGRAARGSGHGRRASAAALALVSALAAVPILAPGRATAAPSGAFTDPAPGLTVPAGTRFRLGWSESGSPPVTSRTLSIDSATLPTPEASCAGLAYSSVATGVFVPTARRVRVLLEGGRCYRFRLRLVDAVGDAITIRSGFVRAGRAAEGDGPEAEFTSPSLGALTDGPPGAYAIAWTERPGVVSRSLSMEAASADGRSCADVEWTGDEDPAPVAGTSFLLELAAGTCYRCLLLATASDGTTAIVRSGVLLATNDPPSCAYADTLTRYRTVGSHPRSLLDPTYRLPSRYAPGDLVSTGLAGLNGG